MFSFHLTFLAFLSITCSWVLIVCLINSLIKKVSLSLLSSLYQEPLYSNTNAIDTPCSLLSLPLTFFVRCFLFLYFLLSPLLLFSLFSPLPIFILLRLLLLRTFPHLSSCFPHSLSLPLRILYSFYHLIFFLPSSFLRFSHSPPLLPPPRLSHLFSPSFYLPLSSSSSSTHLSIASSPPLAFLLLFPSSHPRPYLSPL